MGVFSVLFSYAMVNKGNRATSQFGRQMPEGVEKGNAMRRQE